MTLTVSSSILLDSITGTNHSLVKWDLVSFCFFRSNEKKSDASLQPDFKRVSLDDMPAKTHNHSVLYRVCIHKPKEVNP